MANRIPLIVDTTDGNKIKELPIGSNLDLTGSGIVGTTSIGTTSITADVSVLNSINTNNIIVNASADLGSVENLTINGGTAGQVLSTDGAGNVSFITLGNYDQNLNTTDDVTFNTVGSRRITAPINVTAEIRTSSTGLGNKTWAFGSTGILTLPVDGDIRNSAGQSLLNFTSVPSDIISDVDNTRDLGAVGNRWAQGHFTNIYGALTGELTGNVTGDLTGNVTGNLTGNVTGQLNAGFGIISYSDLAPNQGWNVESNSLPPTKWVFRTTGDLQLPGGGGLLGLPDGDITDAQSKSLLRGNWGVVNIAKINLAGSWPFNGIGFWANPVTTRVWDNSTIILDYDTWEALKAQYPAWVAGDAIPNDLICLGSADYLGRFNNFGKIITPTEFDITTSGGYITDVKVAQAGINQSGLSSDNLQAFLPGDTLTQNTAIPAGGIIGRIPPLPINYQDSGLTLNQGQLVVNPINADSTVEPVVAKFYGDVVVTGDVIGNVVGPIQVDVSNISILGGSVNQVLQTNGAGVLSWVTQSGGGGGGGAVVLDDLTDVVITSVSSGQVLKYDGANWINSAVPLNAFGTITVSGSGINIAPDQLNDTLTFIASTGISMNVDAGTDSITITNTAPNVTQNVFTTVAVAGQNNVVADSSTDTLTLVAGANVTITTNDSTDSITINAGQSNSFVSIAVAGQSPVLADSTSDTLTLVGSGITITTDSVTDTITFSNVGTGLESRTTVAGTTASLASLASADLNITGFKGYVLYKIQTSVAAWVRLYTDGASRTADAGRLEAVDPDPGAGVIAEVITTGGQTILMSPAVMGFNNETSPTTTIPCRVTNKSGSTAAVTVTLTLIKIEA
jgi:hypothetical protein